MIIRVRHSSRRLVSQQNRSEVFRTCLQPYCACIAPLQELPTTARCFSLYKHFVTPRSPLVRVCTATTTRGYLPSVRELPSLAEDSARPPLREVVCHPRGELFSLAGVFITTPKRGCLSTSLRLTTNIADATLLRVTTHRLGVNIQPLQPRLRFNDYYGDTVIYDSTPIKIQPILRFNHTTMITIERYKEDYKARQQFNHDYDRNQDWDASKNNNHDNSTTIWIQKVIPPSSTQPSLRI